MTRFTLNLSAHDLLDLLAKQRARYSGKLDHAVSASDFTEAKLLINKLEELNTLLDANPVAGTEASLTIDMELPQAPSPSLPRGML